MSRERSFELVIFDCDGVLVDSEPIANRVMTEMLSEVGLDLSFDETVHEFMGRSLRTCVEKIERRIARRLPDDFLDRLGARTYDAFRESLRPVEGIEGALDRIDQPICVASSGSHEKMKLTLGLTGLLPRFDGRLFSATEVERGKPFPDLFLHAARRLGVDPGACAVVEDTVVGVEAGVAAGMTVFGYRGLSDPVALAAAGAWTFDDMRGLPDLLGGHPPGVAQARDGG